MQTSTYRAIRHATMIVVALLACSGCVSLEKKAAAGSINAAILRVNPSTCELSVGAGAVTFADAPMRAGQAMTFTAEQFDIRSSNAWYKATFAVTAATDGTACVESGPDPFFRVFGLSMYVPWSSPRTTLRYVANEGGRE